jgi:hypothetical protein
MPDRSMFRYRRDCCLQCLHQTLAYHFFVCTILIVCFRENKLGHVVCVLIRPVKTLKTCKDTLSRLPDAVEMGEVNAASRAQHPGEIEIATRSTTAGLQLRHRVLRIAHLREWTVGHDARINR